MLENRRHMRIRELTDIRWTVLGQETFGEGRVLNISSSGLLLQVDGEFDPSHHGEIFIDGPDEEPLAFGSKKGNVVWVRRMPEGMAGYQCGVEFPKDAPIDRSLSVWLGRKMEELAQVIDPNILRNYVS